MSAAPAAQPPAESGSKDVELVVKPVEKKVDGDEEQEAPEALGYSVVPRWDFFCIFVSLSLAMLMAGLDGSIVVTAMPRIAKDFNALSEVSWTIVSFMLTQTAMTPLTGRFCDVYGRKTTTLFAVGCFVIGSLACALSQSFVQLIVFRSIQGLGGGAIMSAAMVVVGDLTPPATRANWIAPLAGMFAISSVVGPLLGGYLTDGPGWRWAFWINVPIGAPVMAIMWYYMPHSLGREHLIVGHKPAAAAPAPAAAAAAGAEAASAPALPPAPPGVAASEEAGKAAPAPAAVAPAPGAAAPAAPGSPAAPAAPDVFNAGDLDYPGIVTLTVGVICFCLALIWGGVNDPWDSGKIIALLVVAAVFIAAFIYVEAHVAKDPVMPMRLFAVRNYSTGAWMSFFTGFAMTPGYIYLPIFFQYVNQQTAAESGAAMIPMMLGLPVGAIMSGAAVTSTGAYRPFPVIGAIVLVVANYLYSTMDVGTTVGARVGFLILGGIAMGPLVQVPLLQAQNAVAPADMAVTTSAMQFFQSIGALLSTAVGQTVMNARLKDRFAQVLRDFNLPAGGDSNTIDLVQIKAFSLPLYNAILNAYAYAISAIFYIGVAGAAVALLGALATQHVPLRGGAEDLKNKADAKTARAEARADAKAAAADAAAKEAAAPAIEVGSSSVTLRVPVAAAANDDPSAVSA